MCAPCGVHRIRVARLEVSLLRSVAALDGEPVATSKQAQELPTASSTRTLLLAGPAYTRAASAVQEAQRPNVVGTMTVKMLDRWVECMNTAQYDEQCRLQRQVRLRTLQNSNAHVPTPWRALAPQATDYIIAFAGTCVRVL